MPLEVSQLPAGQRARRDRIVAAGARLLERQSFEQVQMAAVAAEAGVALGTLYRYFRSKDQLYAAVLVDWSAWTSTEPEPGGTAEERLRARVDKMLGSVEGRPHFFTMEHALQTTADPVVKAQQQEWSAGGSGWLAQELLARGDEGRRAAEMLWAIVNHVLLRATLHDGSFAEARATVHAFVDLLVEPLGLGGRD